MLNSLQVVMLTTLFVIHLPKNTQMIMVRIFKLVSFDFMHTEPMLYRIFNFRETDSFMTTEFSNGEKTSKFADAGYDSSNFWLMLGPVFLMIIIFAIVVSLK